MKDFGLYDKYTVFDNATGEEKEGVFVLCPLKDQVAREAMRLYAKLTPNKVLAEDLLNWLAVYELLEAFDEEEDN